MTVAVPHKRHLLARAIILTVQQAPVGVGVAVVAANRVPVVGTVTVQRDVLQRNTQLGCGRNVRQCFQVELVTAGGHVEEKQ